MASIGRNDPCPCGSGHKYKKCCLVVESAAALPPELQRALSWHDTDREFAAEVAGWVQKHHPEWIEECHALIVDEAYAEEETLVPFVLVFLLWHYRPEEEPERTPVDLYFAHRPQQLRGRESWLRAQRTGWLSLWEVLEADAGRSLRLRDLYTGDERTVWERGGSRSAHPRQVVLARVVDLGEGLSVMAGCYPLPLPLTVAQELRAAYLQECFPRRRKLKVSELQTDDHFISLTTAFDEFAQNLYDQPPPQLENFHGEPVRWTVDHYTFAASQRKKVLAALAPLGELHDDTLALTEETPRGSAVVGFVRVGADALEAETNSLGRADRLQARLESVAGGLWRHVGRDHPAGPTLPPAPPGPVGPEVHEFLREYRQKLMREWLDQDVPALGGLTPRQAAGSARGRKQLVSLLQGFEDSEARLPEANQISLEFLYVELGLR